MATADKIGEGSASTSCHARALPKDAGSINRIKTKKSFNLP